MRAASLAFARLTPEIELPLKQPIPSFLSLGIRFCSVVLEAQHRAALVQPLSGLTTEVKFLPKPLTPSFLFGIS